MHAPTSISALTLVALFTSAAALPATSPSGPLLYRRNGCYTSGLAFANLHGDSTDTQEVVNDIDTTCNLVANTALAPGESWTHCSEWASSTYNDCYETCLDGCSAVGSGGRGADMASALCSAGCDPNCGGIETGTDHIFWEVKNEHDVEATITWEVCSAAFNTELGGCASGSEQSHDGFWFRIDPEVGGCVA